MERELLEQLVMALSSYNASDMLDGYLDGLGEEFNQRLESLDLPTIKCIEDAD